MNNAIVAFGEIMLRLTPDGEKNSILNAQRFHAVYGGTESNVLVALSAMGNSTRYLTKLPANDLGRGAIHHLQGHGVDCSCILTSGNNMGMYFLEEGFAARQAKVIYCREHAEITTLTEDDFDYDAVFANCALFHISGISFGLSSSVERLCFRLLEEAKNRNIPVSFDFNYRAKLWSVETAAAVYKRIIPYVDTVFCSRLDLTTFLGVTEDTFFSEYLNARVLVVRERTILPASHRITAQVYTPFGLMARAEKETPVLERIGGGDAFAAGFIHGLMHFDENWPQILDYAATCFVLKHTVKGDVLSMSKAEIETYQNSQSKDVKR